MEQFTMADLQRLIVLVVVVLCATGLVYMGKFDPMAVGAIFMAVLSYSFGFSHGSRLNGTNGKGP